jgi:hypothetical protein
MKKILTLGDVHGRDKWMFHTHGSPYEFNHWMTMVENGVPADAEEFWEEMPYTEYDQIIFVGDYVDSFDISNVTILKKYFSSKKYYLTRLYFYLEITIFNILFPTKFVADIEQK